MSYYTFEIRGKTNGNDLDEVIDTLYLSLEDIALSFKITVSNKNGRLVTDEKK